MTWTKVNWRSDRSAVSPLQLFLPNGSHHFHSLHCSLQHSTPLKSLQNLLPGGSSLDQMYFQGLLVFFSFVICFSHSNDITESSGFQSVVPWVRSISITRNLNFKKWLLVNYNVFLSFIIIFLTQ